MHARPRNRTKPSLSTIAMFLAHSAQSLFIVLRAVSRHFLTLFCLLFRDAGATKQRFLFNFAWYLLKLVRAIGKRETHAEEVAIWLRYFQWNIIDRRSFFKVYTLLLLSIRREMTLRDFSFMYFYITHKFWEEIKCHFAAKAFQWSRIVIFYFTWNVCHVSVVKIKTLRPAFISFSLPHTCEQHCL